jgi:hypothetical protein
MVDILQTSKLEFPNNLPPYYESLKHSTGALKTEFAPSNQKNPSQVNIPPPASNECLDGIFGPRDMSNFMALDHSSSTEALRKLLKLLQTQTLKIKTILNKVETKKLSVVRTKQRSFLKQKYPHYFPNQQ